jgi:hypothetical protein
MPAPLTQVVNQFQQDGTGQLEPEASLTACRGIAYRDKVIQCTGHMPEAVAREAQV